MALAHASIHLRHTDPMPVAQSTGITVFVGLDGAHGVAQVYPATAAQAEAIAASFSRAAVLLRGIERESVRA